MLFVELISKTNKVMTKAKMPSVRASILFLLSTVSSSVCKHVGSDITADYLRLAYRYALMAQIRILHTLVIIVQRR
jgi:hypothetical protein